MTLSCFMTVDIIRFQIELEFKNVDVGGEGKTKVPKGR